MKNRYLYISEVTDATHNLALEEYALTHFSEGTIILLWQNAKTIVVGRHQNTMEEINQKYVDDHKITVVRRMTGGGAVYHDLGNLNYSIITDNKGDETSQMKHLAAPLIDTLRQMGIDAEFSGRNDVVVDGKKVSGTAQRLYKNRILHHGCILFDADLSAVSHCLNVDQAKFKSKAVKSVKSRVANIVDFLDCKVSMEEFKGRLSDNLIASKNYQYLVLNETDYANISEIKISRYQNWNWNYGEAMATSIYNKVRYVGGKLEANVDVKEGKIARCKLLGDFMARCSVAEVERRLQGCRYVYEDIVEALNGCHLSDYFGQITKEEVVACICCRE
ncbi:lipoate--protein ligase [Ohessyouella blattaphilus]|uniref:lipoate--protein ligase n=1 Tax=Ohessyouella blattaphilus TaxID=2949333 RepID=A0ABT1EE24_9FIRM|nr:lipoate--protein ligase [Ohessyouella blattaphilus]MCP1108925.1 lipoate--protein ligase [Ohessyouella blattaphilus]MCR8562319.1 lipoate--protein ligase [Ohessyouella blattaphilus]MDL2249024.1 lipoate--protein ligase [Lachnospiraceae bacterium OttesenSCG-928-J05]